MDWLFEAKQDCGRRFPWISIPGVASIVYWVKSVFGSTFRKQLDLYLYPFLPVSDIAISKHEDC